MEEAALRCRERGAAVTELYFWDGWQCVVEATTAGAVTEEYVFGEGIDEVLKARLPDVADLDGDMDTSEKVDLYYHHNSLGSVVAVTDSAGDVVESYRYSPYGEVSIFDSAGSPTAGNVTEVEQPFMFTGRRLDFEEKSGLYYYRLRYYDPVVGRFVSRDPLGMWGDPAQLGNGQSYCGGDPVNFVDPFGRDERTPQPPDGLPGRPIVRDPVTGRTRPARDLAAERRQEEEEARRQEEEEADARSLKEQEEFASDCDRPGGSRPLPDPSHPDPDPGRAKRPWRPSAHISGTLGVGIVFGAGISIVLFGDGIHFYLMIEFGFGTLGGELMGGGTEAETPDDVAGWGSSASGGNGVGAGVTYGDGGNRTYEGGLTTPGGAVTRVYFIHLCCGDQREPEPHKVAKTCPAEPGEEGSAD